MLRVLEFLIAFLIVAFVILEIMIPAARGLPVFPVFRRHRKRALEEQLQRARGHVQERELAEAIKAAEQKAFGTRGDAKGESVPQDEEPAGRN